MLIPFFYQLRDGGMKTSITELLTLLEAMQKGVAGQSDHPLDPGLAPVGGIEERDEVVASGFLVVVGVFSDEDS